MLLYFILDYNLPFSLKTVLVLMCVARLYLKDYSMFVGRVSSCGSQWKYPKVSIYLRKKLASNENLGYWSELESYPRRSPS